MRLGLKGWMNGRRLDFEWGRKGPGDRAQRDWDGAAERLHAGRGLRLEVGVLSALPVGLLHNLGLARESWVFTVRLRLPEE